MPVYEDVTAAFAEARVVLADAFHPDDYEIRRKVRVADGSGGTTTTLQTIETGKCALNAVNRMGAEGTSGSLTVSITKYTVEMPIETSLVAADQLIINERLFEVTEVLKGGDHGIFVTAQVEEAI